ncbi:chemotaxis protein CheX [Dichelobacter nodosus]|nr:chemotaxis protein CheX [Dichelobacter nodosus]KNZ39020.1 chemotaxis protein CheC [Dichelobacter nodosus]TGA66921.1 chemotaxis protein CheX [Dichelobacter nodosus]
MKEERMQVFIDGVNRFFNEVNNINAEVGTPYLVENNTPKAHDYTGIIGISGPYRGCVYFTAPKVLLRHILLSIGENDNNESSMLDLVGEIANTISGNARSEYGETFMISVPMVIQGTPGEIYLPKDARSYVIPITWKQYAAAIVICLQEG